MPANAETANTIAAHFLKRDDAHRAVIELREVEFPAIAIGAVFREGSQIAYPAATDVLESEKIAEPGTRVSANTEPLLPPETPITTLSGGSPFGEASTYQPQPAAEEDWWEGMRVALPLTTSETLPTKPIPHQGRQISEPSDTNFEPADRPAPAYDNDYHTGDYAYETHAFDPTSLATALTATGLEHDHASALANKLNPGESIVTITTIDRASEAKSILTRNNGAIESEISGHASSASASPIAQSAGGNNLRLYGKIRTKHTINHDQA